MCHHYLIQFFLYALTGNYLYPVTVAFESVESFIVDEEVQLCRKTYARSMRKGSSENVMSGSNGVRMIPSSMS